MNIFVLAGGALGILLIIPFCNQVLKKEIVQNPLTFFLWGLLDIVSAGSTYLEGGNYLQATLFAVCAFLATACILYAGGPMKWTEFETLISLLVIFCATVWVFNSNIVGATASLVALAIASVPQIKDTWEKPERTPTLIYFGYALSSLLATFGGKEISIMEIGYPFLGFIESVLIALLSLRKI